MKVLITGAAGFIGSSLAEASLQAGEQVVGLDNFDDFYDPAIKRQNVRALEASGPFEVVEGDIRDEDLVEDVFRTHRPDVVVHLAARAGVRPSLLAAPLYVDVNLRGTTVLLEAARRHGGPPFVFASSSSVYGARPREPFSEDDATDTPVSPYAATKKAGEMLCHAHHAVHGLPVTCLRFFTVYGPKQRPEMAIAAFTRKILAGEPLDLFGDGTARRDFTYIDDIVAGIRAAMTRRSGYRVYNLGGGDDVEIRRLIELIGASAGREPSVRRLPASVGDVPNTLADVSRAEAELGYRPRVRIAEGVERYVRWYVARAAGSGSEEEESREGGPAANAT